jgi:hypothetical protein
MKPFIMFLQLLILFIARVIAVESPDVSILELVPAHGSHENELQQQTWNNRFTNSTGKHPSICTAGVAPPETMWWFNDLKLYSGHKVSNL